MTPEKIADREYSFALKLIDSAATQFTAGEKINIGGDVFITPLTAPHDSYYYKAKTKKTQICLHFTAGVLPGDISALSKPNNHVSVPFVVARDGNIYQLFDPDYWSYHLGSAAIGGNGVMSKMSIGIEISNYGPMKLQGDKFIDAYGSTYTSDPSFIENVSYRGYDYYAKMTDCQIDSVCYLIKYLCDKFDIPDIFKEDIGNVFGSPSDAKLFTGIMCHSDVRADKFDWPPEIALKVKNRYDELFHKVISVECPPEPEPELPVAADHGADDKPLSELHEFTVGENAAGDPVVVDKTAEIEPSAAQKSVLQKILDILLGLFKPRQK